MDSSFHAPVRRLSEEVARKIAAGEVIDRPASVLRELLDNAVDSGADAITVEIRSGGIDFISVTDNGHGMTKEDLLNCAHPHSTSKITSEDDLHSLTTLGFRGEALASIAAVSRLSITSRREGEDLAWHMEAPLAGNGSNTVTPCQWNAGTVVTSLSLFENVPARRLFLKRPQAETTLCRQIFIEKALPRTDISFKLIVDGKTRLELSKGQSPEERFVTALELSDSPDFFAKVSRSDTKLFTDIDEKKGDWSFSLVLGKPEAAKPDKKFIYIYVNGRRVTEYSLVQAIEYGAQGYFPNGTHPAAVLFLQMNPALVDFNIHPAKKEVRFKDSSVVHHQVVGAVRTFYEASSRQGLTAILKQDSKAEKTPLYADKPFFSESLNLESDVAEKFGSYSRTPRFSNPNMYEKSDSSSTSDNSGSFSAKTSFSHTSEDFSSRSPYSGTPSSGFSSHSDFGRPADFGKHADLNESSIESHDNSGISFAKEIAATVAAGTLARTETTSNQYGFRYLGQIMSVFLVVEKGNSLFLIDQHAGHERVLFNAFMEAAGQKQKLLIPYDLETDSEEDDEYLLQNMDALNEAGFELTKENEGKWLITSVPVKWRGTAKDLQEAILKDKKEGADIIRTIAAYSSCKAAIKEGHYIDSSTAEHLIKDVFALPDPHCPHGRPVWTELTKESLYQLVKRT